MTDRPGAGRHAEGFNRILQRDLKYFAERIIFRFITILGWLGSSKSLHTIGDRSSPSPGGGNETAAKTQCKMWEEKTFYKFFFTENFLSI